MKVARPATRRGRIEMIPLIDVVFLLLVAFIYAMISMKYHGGIMLELPAAASAERPEDEVRAVVSIDAEGRIFVQKNEVRGLEEMIAAVRSAVGGEETPLIYLAGHRDAAHGRVVEVLDRLRMEGYTDVLLETAKERP